MEQISLRLQRSTKESLKTALAMVLAYAIALQMDWGKPVWAGLAVAMVSESALGLSLNKAGLRMLGTFLAVVVAFLLIALFPQERWMFMIALSLWLGLCTYLALGSSHSYFWRVGGFVTAIICVSAVTASTSAFEVGVLRAQQTGLGVLVYSLVALLIWPNSSRDELLASYTSLQRAQLAFFQECRVVLSGSGSLEKLADIRVQLLRAQSSFDGLMDSAVADSYTVWELRRQWRAFAAVSGELTELLQRLGESLPEAAHLPISKLIPNLGDVCSRIEQRLQAASPISREKKSAPTTAKQEIRVNTEELRKQGILNSATLALLRRLLSDLDQRSLALEQVGGDISANGGRRHDMGPIAKRADSGLLMPDPDRLAAVLRVMISVWLAYLAYIYIEGLPAGPLLVSLAASLSIALSAAPFISPMRLFAPVSLSIAFGGLIYMLLLPRLSEFWQLGLVLFAATFLVCQLFADPGKAAGKAIGLSFFLSVINISNDQTYSFMVVANISVQITLLLVLLTFTAYIPFSPRPERMFQRLLNQFFRSCETLLAGLAARTEANRSSLLTGTRKVIDWRSLYHRHMITQTPARLSLLAKFIDQRYCPAERDEALQELIGKVEALGARITAIEDAGFGASPEAAESAADIAVREWCDMVRKGLLQLSLTAESSAGGVFDEAEFRRRQNDALSAVEAGLRASASEQRIGVAEEMRLERFLSVLGLARSINRSLVSLARGVRAVDWRRWKETQFF